MSLRRVRKGLTIRGRRSYEEIDATEHGENGIDTREKAGGRRGDRGWTWSSFFGGFAVGFISRGNAQPSPQAWVKK